MQHENRPRWDADVRTCRGCLVSRVRAQIDVGPRYPTTPSEHAEHGREQDVVATTGAYRRGADAMELARLAASTRDRRRQRARGRRIGTAGNLDGTDPCIRSDAVVRQEPRPGLGLHQSDGAILLGDDVGVTTPSFLSLVLGRVRNARTLARPSGRRSWRTTGTSHGGVRPVSPPDHATAPAASTETDTQARRPATTAA